MVTRHSAFLTMAFLPRATLMLAAPVGAQIFRDGDRGAKPAKPAQTASPPKIDPADIGKPPVSPGDDVSWRSPVIPPLHNPLAKTEPKVH